MPTRALIPSLRKGPLNDQESLGQERTTTIKTARDNQLEQASGSHNSPLLACPMCVCTPIVGLPRTLPAPHSPPLAFPCAYLHSRRRHAQHIACTPFPAAGFAPCMPALPSSACPARRLHPIPLPALPRACLHSRRRPAPRVACTPFPAIGLSPCVPAPHALAPPSLPLALPSHQKRSTSWIRWCTRGRRIGVRHKVWAFPQGIASAMTSVR
ncbi:hypothetical protein EDB87DRAFT_953714 [Lactarius vividus]|nr:hypothetical protein EDB87DRAFT_953714 [Lactarius vividus]